MSDYVRFRDALFDSALQNGCEAAELYYTEGEHFSVRVLEQQIENYEVSHSCGFGLRVKVNGRDGYAYTEVSDDPQELVRRAVDNARTIENTDVCPMQGPQVYDNVIPPENPLGSWDERQKIELAMELERLTLAADSRVSRVSCAAVGTARSVVRLDNTLGLHAEQCDESAYCYVSAIAEQNGEVHDGSAFRVNATAADVADCAQEAVREAVSRFGASSVPAGTSRVLLRYDVMADLLDAFSPVFNADRVQKGLSPLSNCEGKQLASQKVTLRDDPFYPSLARAFDDEGTPSVVTEVIRDGVLCSFLHNLKTAGKAGTISTSNAARSPSSPVSIEPSNFYLVPGETNVEQLMQLLNDGLYITGISGLHAGVNSVSGDFSLLAEGFLVQRGSIIRPVEQITVAGNFLSLLADIEAIGNDLTFGMPSGSCFGSPSVLIGHLQIAGQ